MPSWLMEERGEEKERRERETKWTRLKTRSQGSREKTETFSYYTGDAPEMEQEIRTCEKEVMGEK